MENEAAATAAVVVGVVERQKLVLVAGGGHGCVVIGKLFNQQLSWELSSGPPGVSFLPTATSSATHMGPPTHHGRHGIKKIITWKIGITRTEEKKEKRKKKKFLPDYIL